jgi:hypothetical protein
MKIGSTDSGGYVKFTPKYSIVGVKEGCQDLFEGCNLICSVTEDCMENFKILALLLLGVPEDWKH